MLCIKKDNERENERKRKIQHIYIYTFQNKGRDKKKGFKKSFTAPMYKGLFYEKNSNVFVSLTSINWDNKFNMYLPQ